MRNNKQLRIWLAGLLVLLPLLADARDTLFPRPAGLEADVGFWVRVYSEVDTRGGLLHDHRHLDVVYEVLQFPEDATAAGERALVREARQRYEALLRGLATGSHEDLDEDARRVLALWPEDVSRETLAAAVRRVRFQRGQADRFRAGLQRSGRWLPHIYQTLEDMDLPRELAMLPHVESSFYPDAWSRVGAAGMWQFTRATGQRFMRVDHVVDERLDPYVSSVAAARLLEHNHASVGTWPLALTAYNHGSAGMRRAVRAMGTTDIETISREYDGRAFGFASRNFYLAFLAALEVHERADELFGAMEMESPLDYQTAPAPAYLPAAQLAEVLGVELAVLREYNRGLLSPVWQGHKLIPRGYQLRIPDAYLEQPLAVALAGLDNTLLYARQRPDVEHVVARGDSLSRIAARYGVGVNELASMNNLGNRHLIRVGQTLRLPVTDSTAAPVRLPEDGIYRVRRGDTVSTVARRFGLTERDLVAYNEFDDRNRIDVGQALRLTPAGPAGAVVAHYTEETAADEAGMAAQADEADEEAVAATEVQPGDDATHTTQPPLSADPSDYAVAPDQTIEVQVGETLGHFAHWLELPARRLRQQNAMTFGTPVRAGERLRLDFSRVDEEQFVDRRVAHHGERQERFFAEFRIVDSREYHVRSGDSLWSVARQEPNVPMWLLRQYNPDEDFRALVPGVVITMPVVERRPAEELASEQG